MVERSLDAVFHALADPTRRQLLRRLARRDTTVGDLARPIAMTLAAVSKHVKVLENAGLVQRTISGRTHTLRLNAARLRHAQEWLSKYERYWNQRLDALEAAIGGDDD